MRVASGMSCALRAMVWMLRAMCHLDGVGRDEGGQREEMRFEGYGVDVKGYVPPQQCWA